MRSRNLLTTVAFVTVSCPASASASASVPVPGAKCGACHTEEARTQPRTSMAQALLPAGINDVLKAQSMLTFRNGAYLYTIERGNAADSYTVTDGVNKITRPIRWVFGAKSQTYVLEYEGRLYESLVSYYAPINALNITMGDEEIRPKTLVEAMGRELSGGEARACFQCHATRAVANDEIQMGSLVRGVQCERCHTGANAHAEGISRGKLESMPAKLSRISAEDMSNFCGQCHRSFADVVRDRLFGQINVRFQPYRLANSKCFDGSDARISCVACHNPHHEITGEPASYDSKCLACHQSATVSNTPASAGRSASAKHCPVATSNCVSCHMPKVELPGGHQVFRDHYIRVVRANEPYPN